MRGVIQIARRGVWSVAAGATLLTLLMAAPVVREPSKLIFGSPIVGRHHDPFTVMQQWQGPLTFGPYALPLTDWIGSALTRLIGPVAAFNLVVLITFPLAAVTTFLLVHVITRSRAAAVFAAFAYAFAPFHLAHAAYHPHVAQVQWLPLYGLALGWAAGRATAVSLFWLVLAMVAVGLSDPNTAFAVALTTPAALVLLWVWPQTSSSRRVQLSLALTILVLAAAAVAAYLWVASPARAAVLAPFAAFPVSAVEKFSARWWSYLLPPVAHPVLGVTTQSIWMRHGIADGLLEQQVSLGWAMLTLAGYAIWLRCRNAPGLRGRQAVPVLAGVAAVAFLCSLGPEVNVGGVRLLLPSGYLHEIVPLFRAYARVSVVVSLTVITLAAIAFAHLLRSERRPAAIAAIVLAVVAAFEYAPLRARQSRDVLPTDAHRWLAEETGSLRVLDCTERAQAVDRSVSWLLGHPVALAEGDFADCAEPHIESKLSAYGFTHLVTTRESAQDRWLTDAPQQVEGLQLLRSFPDSRVYAVRSRDPLIVTTVWSGFYQREYLGATTWRWMNPPAHWTVLNRSDGRVTAMLEIELIAFPHARPLSLVLNGRVVGRLSVVADHRRYEIGPLLLEPRENRLQFEAHGDGIAPSTIGHGADPRPLAMAIGTWRWRDAATPPSKAPSQ